MRLAKRLPRGGPEPYGGDTPCGFVLDEGDDRVFSGPQIANELLGVRIVVDADDEVDVAGETTLASNGDSEPACQRKQASELPDLDLDL